MDGKKPGQDDTEFQEEDFSADDLYDEDLAELDVSDELPVEEFEEGLEEELPDDSAAMAPAKRPKKKLSSNAIALIVAGVVGFGVMVYQVISKAPAPAPQQTFESGLTRDTPASEAMTDTGAMPSSETAPQTGFLDNPEMLSTPAEETPSDLNAVPRVVEDAPPMPAPIASEDMPPSPVSSSEALTPMPVETVDIPAPPSPEIEQTPRAPEETAAAEFPEAFMKAQPEQEIPAPTAPVGQVNEPEMPAKTSPEVSNPAPEASAEMMQAMDEMTKQLKSISKRLDSLDKKIEDVGDENVKRTASLSEKMATFEKDMAAQMDGMKQEMNSAPLQNSPETARPAEPEKAVVAPAPTPTKTASVPKKVSKPAAPKWELRAAQPDRAWVSQPGKKEMRQVRVGDSLPGIGRITSIAYVGNMWIVQGTEGKITQ